MTASSQSTGWRIVWRDGRWVYSDTLEPISTHRPCRNCRKDAVLLKIKHARPGRATRFIKADIDACIAPIVDALNQAGIYTIGSCCGHGRSSGSIVLADGREMIICTDTERKSCEESNEG